MRNMEWPLAKTSRRKAARRVNLDAGSLLRLGRLCGLQSLHFEQRFDARVAPAPGTIKRVGFLGAAAREDHVAEALAVLAGHAAVFLEPVERVVAQHRGPQVGVIAGGVAVG